MKILYCYRYGILGGVCTQLSNRLRYLSTLDGWEVHALFSKDYGVKEFLGDKVKLHFEKPVEGLAEWADKEKFDIVIVIDTPEYFTAFSKENRTYKLIAEVHTSIAKSLEHLKTREWQADLFLVPSDYMKKELSQNYSIKDSEIIVTHNSLDMEIFAKQNCESRYRVPVLLWVGKIDDHKDWKAFLQVSKLVKEKGIEFESWIIGGQTCNEQVRHYILEFAEELGLLKNFRWFDRIENKAMPKVYSAVADCGGCNVITSHNESFGMSLLESIACGCPVVSTDVGALGEITDNDDYVSLYSLGDYQAAADAIAKFLEPGKARLARESLEKDFESLKERYSPINTGKRYVDALSGIAG